jgi:hypothetical protein
MPGADASDEEATAAAVRRWPAGAMRLAFTTAVSWPVSCSFVPAVCACPELLCPALTAGHQAAGTRSAPREAVLLRGRARPHG